MRGDAERPAHGAGDGGQRGRREVVGGKRGGDVALVAGGQQAADDSHPERSPDLQQRAVGGGADAGVLAGQ